MNHLRESRDWILPLFLILVFIFAPLPKIQTINDEITVSEVVPENHSDGFVKSDVVLGRVNYTVYNTSEAFEGYNLFTLYEYDMNLGNRSNLLLIMDMDGNVIAQKQLGDIGAASCNVEFLNPDTILVGTAQGAALWHIENDTMDYLGFEGHHEYEYNSKLNTIFTFEKDYQYIAGVYYLFDIIKQYDMNGNLVWSWPVSDFIPTGWWCPYQDMVGDYRDISHSNTIYYDGDEDIIYYNSRHTNTFWKLNYTSKEVIWAVGEHGDFTMFDLQGNQVSNLFYHAHAVEPVDENTFILFDNDYHNQTDPLNEISRIVEITIDENTMTANESW
ncbi:MAG: aryl-sulfate sulfotransferase, partial [Candidatus Thorarchaeota archaeon]